MTRRAALVLALMIAPMFSTPAAAQIYSWKDKDGRTHYSDVPPPTGEVKTLRGAPARASTPAASDTQQTTDTADGSSKPAADSNAPSRDPRDAASRAAEAEAREADRQRFCEQARNQVTALRSGQRMARLNANGEPEFLDDAARAAEAERLQGQADQICK